MTISALQEALSCPPPWIVGVVNITPDSFSDTGHNYNNVAGALAHARKLINDGAHIIEIGGEATGPGTQPISWEDDLRRIEFVVSELAPECFVSIDTYHAETARRCLEYGAKMINDVSALRAEPELADIVASFNGFLVLMHSKETGNNPHVSDEEAHYSDVIDDINSLLSRQLTIARESGISPGHIVLDPGMGRFLSRDPEVSWEVLRRYYELCEGIPDCPWMVAVSRKGFLGGDIQDRDPISQQVALYAVAAGASIIRTHNAKMCRAMLDCYRKIVEE